MNKADLLIKELSFEKYKWDCPDYHCTVLTTKDCFKGLVDYMVSCSYVRKIRQGFDVVTLNKGGTLRFQDICVMSEEDVERNNGGDEYTTVILDVSSEDWNLGVYGINYLMTRLRSESKHPPRMVVV